MTAPQKEPAGSEREALLPCPFCGNEADTEHADDCYFSVANGMNVTDARLAWNRRASQPSGAAGEALRLILPMAKGYAAEHWVGSNAAYIAEAESVLASLASPSSGGWQSIESAPKDGSEIESHTCDESSECVACDDLRTSAAFAMGYLSNTLAGALGEREWKLAEPKIHDVLRFIERCATASEIQAAQCPNCKGTLAPSPLDPDWQGRCECAATHTAIAARGAKKKEDFRIDDAMEAIRLIVGEDADVLLSDEGEGRVYSVLEQISHPAPEIRSQEP